MIEYEIEEMMNYHERRRHKRVDIREPDRVFDSEMECGDDGDVQKRGYWNQRSPSHLNSPDALCLPEFPQLHPPQAMKAGLLTASRSLGEDRSVGGSGKIDSGGSWLKVSIWFINAWVLQQIVGYGKSMVEEIYLEEIKIQERKPIWFHTHQLLTHGWDHAIQPKNPRKSGLKSTVVTEMVVTVVDWGGNPKVRKKKGVI
ncbi:hypothetical protein E3N88_35041 [Mikania micrantha]|uniref:Uncharacterized protein n=1 Tax=Mikania micrantha TaxID=192012 RepID=A0A5N6M050_9ASTR|nr:hypothetical protein E3N88_35041 [Mikania micrantha]